jgi:hypothetical protein
MKWPSHSNFVPTEYLKVEIFNKEDTYDNEISPLVRQPIEICKEHGIPMIASFTYEVCGEKGPGRCTTLINDIPDRRDEIFQQAVKIIKNGGHTTLAIAVGKSQ